MTKLTEKRTDTRQARRRAFLEAFRATNGNASAACRRVGVARSAVYKWHERDPAFAGEWNRIIEEAFGLSGCDT